MDHEIRRVSVPPERRDLFRDMVRAGTLEVVGPMHERDGVLYVTVRRAVTARTYRGTPDRPAWVRPVAVAGGLAGAGLGVLGLVAYLVRTMTTAVAQSGPALGFVLALAVVLLLAAALRRRGRTVTVTTVTTTRVRVK